LAGPGRGFAFRGCGSMEEKRDREVLKMLNLTIKAGEYFTIGDDIKVVVTGGSGNHYRVMVDAPREYNIVRGEVLEKNAVTAEEKRKLKKFYPEPKIPAEDMRRIIAKQRREQAERKRA